MFFLIHLFTHFLQGDIYTGLAHSCIFSSITFTDLNLSEDVAGATFMAIATSSPELFINFVGTFITESDLGVGTMVGSAVFNVLGVATCLGLAASKVILTVT
jgi:Ca2+/Na+ antiporter